MSDPVLVRVKPAATKGLFANGVLHAPGEQLYVDLEALGITTLEGNRVLEPGDPSVPVFTPEVPAQRPDASTVPPLSPAVTAGLALPEALPPIRREGEGEGGEDAEAQALVDGNTKAELLELAKDIPGVSEDNNKAEIAAKIVAKRRAG